MKRRYLLFIGCALILTLNACFREVQPLRPQAKLEVIGATTLTLNGGASNSIQIRNAQADTTLTWEARPSQGLQVSPPRGQLAGNQGNETIRIETTPDSANSSGTVELYQNQELRETITVTINAFNCATTSASQLLASQSATMRSASLQDAYVPNQVVIRYVEEGLNAQALQIQKMALAQELGFQTLYDAQGTGSDLIEVQGDAQEIAAVLQGDTRVLYAHPNYFLRPLGFLNTQGFVPNDTNYSSQWYLKRFGLEQAWDIEKGSSDITIAIIDSGVDVTHEDLANKIVAGCDMYTPSTNPSPTNPANSHGTHVAGIAAAVGNNAKGISGVAPEGVKILPIKVFTENGGTTLFVTAKAIRWAAGLPTSGFVTNPKPAQIINLSLGALLQNVAVLDEAVEAAANAGSLVVAASGNDADKTLITTPASAPKALAVGSVSGQYKHSCFSNYAASNPLLDSSPRTVDLVAPGGGRYGFQVLPNPQNPDDVICTKNALNQDGEIATRQTILSTVPQNDYGYEAGTSMATPFVSGVAALIWSQNPELTADEVRVILLASVKNDMPFYDADKYGAGILCADKALGASTTCGE